MEWLYILLILFIVIIIFIVTIVLLANSKTVYAPSSTPEVTLPPGFGYSCKSEPCPTGYICDLGTVTCRLPLGATCTDFSQCTIGNYCSGVCVNGPHGGVLQPCPCNSGLACTTTTTGARVCLGTPGFPCTTNNECVSQFCNGGFCSSGNPDGFACTSNSQCNSNNCDMFGFCQPQGEISGVTGAVCIPGQPPPGTSGATGAGCNSGLACTNGHCLPANGLGHACGTSSGCAPPLLCTNLDTGGLCSGSNNCSCLFPNDPNTCPTGVCMNSTNYQCEIATSQCFAFGLQPCIIDQDCASGRTCSGNNSVLRLVTNSVSPINPLGATQFSWELHSQALVSFSKMTGYTVGTTDKLYAIAADGLYNFNGSSWIKIIPSPMTTGSGTRTLISAVATSNLILVAFHETSGIMTDYTVYSLNGLTLTPFNVISQSGHIDGTQYSTTNVPLPISDIDVSASLDVVLLSSNNPYIKAASVTQYSLRNKTNGNQIVGPPITNVTLPRFYFDTYEIGATGATINFPSDYNFGYVGPSNSSQLLQFNGDISGAFYPRDLGTPDVHTVTDVSLYTPTDCNPQNTNCGIKASTFELISLDQSLGSFHDYLVVNGIQLKIPGFIDNRAKVLVTGLHIYLFVPTVCSI